MLADLEIVFIMISDMKKNRAQKAGGLARAANLSADERKAIASKAAQARWAASPNLENDRGEEVVDLTAESEESLPLTGLPVAEHRGVLPLMGLEIPCYVLSDGQRVIGRTSATEMLTGIKGGGAFEKYIGVSALRPFIDVEAVSEQMVSFRLPEVEGLERGVKGLPADLFIEVCQGFVRALEASTRLDSGVRLTSRQLEMALKASMFLSAVAKTGLDALIDEATGYQYERAEDALQVKLRAYLSEEMRKWEKTFPDELWQEFGRLTGWRGAVTKRPKYWGKLVIELVYDYMNPDVSAWLKENAPAPRKGQNYHQWLTSQYGLQKLIEHIWKLIGIAKTCQSMPELKSKMGTLHGRVPVQFTLFLPPTSRE